MRCVLETLLVRMDTAFHDLRFAHRRCWGFRYSGKLRWKRSRCILTKRRNIL